MFKYIGWSKNGQNDPIIVSTLATDLRQATVTANDNTELMHKLQDTTEVSEERITIRVTNLHVPQNCWTLAVCVCTINFCIYSVVFNLFQWLPKLLQVEAWMQLGLAGYPQVWVHADPAGLGVNCGMRLRSHRKCGGFQGIRGSQQQQLQATT